MFVSFIVPVYKVEAYLNDCVQSLISQTFQDFEIILVDDGSPDKCPEICDELAESDRRIRVVHKANGGLSDARNTGLSVAKGDYVIFVDSDDFWMCESSLESLVKEVENHPGIDMLQFNCSYFFQGSKYRRWKPYSSRILDESDKERIICLLVASGVFPMSAWMKMIRKDFLISNNIFFKKGILCEDIPWFIELLEKAGTIRFVNEYIYAYRQNVVGSITNTFSLRTFDDLFSIVKNITAEIPCFDMRDETRKSLYSFMAYEFCILMSNINKLPVELQVKKREELLKYRWLLQYKANPKVRLVSNLSRILGIRMTERLLNFYQDNH